MSYICEKKELFLMQQIYATLTSLAKKLDKQNNKYSNGLTAKQYLVLLAIRHSPPNETTMVNIAKKLDTTKQNINQLVPVLEKKGYLSRSVCENNKRAVNIQVTDSGLLAMREFAGTGASMLMDIFNGFTEKEMEMLLHLLQKLNSFDGESCLGFRNDINQLFESEYSDLLTKILEEYKKRQPSLKKP